MMNKVQYGYDLAQRDVDRACRKLLRWASGKHTYKFKYEVAIDGKKKVRAVTFSADTKNDARLMFLLAIHDCLDIKDIQEVK